jgi:hypothetical protein
LIPLTCFSLHHTHDRLVRTLSLNRHRESHPEHHRY